MINCQYILTQLYHSGYEGKIMFIDNDCLSPDTQLTLLGELCHGKGEAFHILHGSINGKIQLDPVFAP